jgi:hypothetical protein
MPVLERVQQKWASGFASERAPTSLGLARFPGG